jgi:hypothetical protein
MEQSFSSVYSAYKTLLLSLPELRTCIGDGDGELYHVSNILHKSMRTEYNLHAVAVFGNVCRRAILESLYPNDLRAWELVQVDWDWERENNPMWPNCASICAHAEDMVQCVVTSTTYIVPSTVFQKSHHAPRANPAWLLEVLTPFAPDRCDRLYTWHCDIPYKNGYMQQIVHVVNRAIIAGHMPYDALVRHFNQPNSTCPKAVLLSMGVSQIPKDWNTLISMAAQEVVSIL